MAKLLDFLRSKPRPLSAEQRDLMARQLKVARKLAKITGQTPARLLDYTQANGFLRR